MGWKHHENRHDAVFLFLFKVCPLVICFLVSCIISVFVLGRHTEYLRCREVSPCTRCPSYTLVALTRRGQLQARAKVWRRLTDPFCASPKNSEKMFSKPRLDLTAGRLCKKRFKTPDWSRLAFRSPVLFSEKTPPKRCADSCNRPFRPRPPPKNGLGLCLLGSG